MKYQFTAEGSKPQTKYHHIRICDKETGETLYEIVLSSAAMPLEVETTLEYYLNANKYCENMCVKHVATYNNAPDCGATLDIINVATMCRIISNIKPLKKKVVISICGEKKVYELDADKLETLLKSLE